MGEQVQKLGTSPASHDGRGATQRQLRRLDGPPDLHGRSLCARDSSGSRRPEGARPGLAGQHFRHPGAGTFKRRQLVSARDRKSTRLNSSHLVISYAVFCLKKKKTKVKPLSLTVVKK